MSGSLHISIQSSFYVVVLRVSDGQDPSVVFRGFFIQARLVADGSNVGGFLAPQAGQDYQLSSCTPSTVRYVARILNGGGGGRNFAKLTFTLLWYKEISHHSIILLC